jgi:hypothetical protein
MNTERLERLIQAAEAELELSVRRAYELREFIRTIRKFIRMGPPKGSSRASE